MSLSFPFSKSVSNLLSLAVIAFVAFGCVWNMRKTEGLWITFDDVHVVRTLAMVDELKSGQFPVRMVGSFGNGGGYMLFNFYSPLTYYLTASAVLLGFHPVHAVKLAFQAAYVIAGFGMFFFLRQLRLTRPLSVFGSLLLITSAYFNYDAYIRGALGELLGFALIPWVYVFYTRFRVTFSHLDALVLSLLITLFFYVHAITAFITLPFLGAWICYDLLSNKLLRRKLLLIGFTMLLALLLSASYTLPVVFERNYITYDQSEFVNKDFGSSFKSVSELLAFPPRRTEILMVTLGSTLSLFTIYSLMVFVSKVRQKSPPRYFREVGLVFLASLLVALFLQTQLSKLVWEYVPFVKLTQFPYRYLTITTFTAISFGVITLSYVKDKLIITALIAIISVSSYFSNAAYFVPQGYYFAEQYLPSDECATTTWDQEYLPVWTSQCQLKDTPLVSSSATLTVNTVTSNYNGRLISVQTKGSGELKVAKYYYPGWTAQVNGQPTPIRIVPPTGSMAITVEEEQGLVELKFGNTLLRTVSDYLTVIGLLLSILWIFVICIRRLNQFRKKLSPSLL